MYTCDQCGTNMDKKNSCPNCNASYCDSCLKKIIAAGNHCPQCGKSPDTTLGKRADFRTRGNPG